MVASCRSRGSVGLRREGALREDDTEPVRGRGNGGPWEAGSLGGKPEVFLGLAFISQGRLGTPGAARRAFCRGGEQSRWSLVVIEVIWLQSLSYSPVTSV